VDENVKTDYGRMRRLAESVSARGNRERFIDIIKNETVESEIVPRFSFEMMYQEQYFVSLLFYMGLLTIEDFSRGAYTLKIPNHVVKSIYGEYFLYVLHEQAGVYDNISALTKIMSKMAYDEHIEPFIEFFKQGLLPCFSNRDLIGFDEKYVKAMLLCLIRISGMYIPVSEREVEAGYTDIFLQKDSRYDFDTEWIIELKYVKMTDEKKKDTKAKIPSEIQPESNVKPKTADKAEKNPESQAKRIEKAKTEAIKQLKKYNDPKTLDRILRDLTDSDRPFFKTQNVRKVYMIIVGKRDVVWGEL
jgi:hypothetical protein